MCLAVPAKILEIKGMDAIAEIHKVKTNIRIDLIEDCKVGDHVLLHAGFAINKLDEEALKEINEAWGELAEKLTPEG